MCKEHAVYCLWPMIDLDLHSIIQLVDLILERYGLVACLAACGLQAYVERHAAALKCCL